MKLAPLLFTLAAEFLFAAAAQAAGLAGTWQGALPLPNDPHLIITFSSATTGWRGSAYQPDSTQAADTTLPLPVDRIAVSKTGASFAIQGARFNGTFSPDGNTLTGNLTQGTINLALKLERSPPATLLPLDASAHKLTYITIDKNIRLEVLDWGGTGRPLIFLPGLGFTAHEFDTLAPEFTETNHVFAITRRGFGNSSKPDPVRADYSSDRLGDDVLAVIKALKLERPVLAGHSVAGEEMSSIGSRHSEAVAGLIYLDAAYSYAYYAPGNAIPLGVNLLLDARELRSQLEKLQTLPHQDQDLAPIIRALQDQLPNFEKDLAAANAALKAEEPGPAPAPDTAQERIEEAVSNGAKKYTQLNVPILALFEGPPLLPANTPANIREAQNAQFAAQAAAFEAGVPSARVVRLPNARHALWMTNKADVVREMKKFLAGLS